MKVRYYGTGAGAGIPEIFCSCRICEEARRQRGRDIRTRSQATIDDRILIDFPVDTFLHTIYGGLDVRKFNHLLVTHDHFDHFLHQDLFSRPKGADTPLNIYITEPSAAKAMAVQASREAAFSSGKRVRTDEIELIFHIIKSFTPLMLPGYRITPLAARHAPAIEAVVYAIEDVKSGKSVFWGHDTGLLPKDTKLYLLENFAGRPFDFVSLDCTLERGNCITAGHMDLDRCLEMIDWMRTAGIARVDTKFVISHIGHLVKRTHSELCAEAGEHGVITAYDGLVLEF